MNTAIDDHPISRFMRDHAGWYARWEAKQQREDELALAQRGFDLPPMPAVARLQPVKPCEAARVLRANANRRSKYSPHLVRYLSGVRDGRVSGSVCTWARNDATCVSAGIQPSPLSAVLHAWRQKAEGAQ